MARQSQKSQKAQKTWEERINRAKAVRRHWKEMFKVALARDYWEGRQNPGFPDEEWITINKVYTAVKAQLPALYAHDPYFYVRLKKSYKPDEKIIALWDKKGEMRGAMLNYYKEELGLKHKTRRCIRDAMFAYGVMKTHYRIEERENPDAGKVIEYADGSPMLDDGGDFLVEPDMIPVNEKYCWTRVHPDDFMFDEDAGPDPESWRWVAQCVRLSLEDARKDTRFSKAALKDLEGKGEVKDDEFREREERKKGSEAAAGHGSYFDDQKKKKPAEPVVTWEIYHIKDKTWTVIAEGGNVPLVEEEPYPPGIEDHPFSYLVFTERDDSPYPIPPMSQGLDVQKEYNLGRSKLMTHRKRFNRKYVLDGSAFDSPDDAAGKLESGEDGTVLIASRPGAETTAVFPIKDAPLDQMNYQELGLLNADMVELFGNASDNARGVAGADTATEAGILEKRMELREGDSMSAVIDFTKENARKMDMLIQTHIDREQAVKVTGPSGAAWQIVQPSDYDEIEGEYSMEVNVGATIPRLPQMERASFMAVLGVLANAPQLLLSRRLVKEICRMHHLEDETLIEELYNIGQQIMSGRMPMPGQSGSQPNVTEQRPQSATGGQAGGPASLMLPGAGNL